MKDRAPAARRAGARPKQEGWGVRVWGGSSARLRVVLGVKAKGQEMSLCANVG